MNFLAVRKRRASQGGGISFLPATVELSNKSDRPPVCLVHGDALLPRQVSKARKVKTQRTKEVFQDVGFRAPAMNS